MSPVIPFPKLQKPAPLQLVSSQPVKSKSKSDAHLAKLSTRAASSAAAALLDLSLCAQGLQDGEPFHISDETIVSLVEALRLSILATGCRNQDRPLITALCAWSESTKEPAQ